MDISNLLTQVLNSRISALMLNDMTVANTEDRSVPYSTRLAFDSRMRSDAGQFNQSSQNMRDAAAMVEVAQSGVTAIKNELSGMYKLLSEMAGSTELSAEQYESYSLSLKQQAEIAVGLANGVEFNGMTLLNGTAGMNSDGTVVLQAGGNQMDQVFYNLVNSDIAGNEVLGNDGSMNLTNLIDKTTITSIEEAEKFHAEMTTYIDRLGGMEADYSYDIKSLNSLAVLFDNQADIYNNTVQYRSEGNGSSSAATNNNNILSEILLAGLSGNIVSGNA